MIWPFRKTEEIEVAESGAESEVHAISVSSVQELLDPDIFALVRDGLASNPLCNLKLALVEVAGALSHPQADLICVQEDGAWVAMALLQHGKGLVDGSFVLHFYNDGTAHARAALVEAILEKSREAGSRRLFGFDINDKELAFKRLFSNARPKTTYGVLVEFEL